MFLHGWGGGLESFIGIAKMLTDSYRCLLFSLLDEVPIDALHLDDYANYVKSVISKYDYSELIIVGHSFGGRVALRIATTSVVDKIVLVDSAGLKPKRTIKYYLRVINYKTRKLLGWSTKGCGAKDFISLCPVMKKTFNNIVKEFQDNELAFVKCKTLVFWGENDTETPLYMARKLTQNIATATMYTAKNCGHYSYLEAPYLFIKKLIEFIDDRREYGDIYNNF